MKERVTLLEWYREYSRVVTASALWMNHGLALATEERSARMQGVDQAQSGPQNLMRFLLARTTVAPRSVLDVGCGRGASLAYFSKDLRSSLAVGVDPVLENLLCGRCHHAGFPVLGESEGLPFPDALFDVTVSLEAMHLFSCRQRALCEMARVTRPGGVVLLADGMARDNTFPVKEVLEVGLGRIQDEGDITEMVAESLRRRRSTFGKDLLGSAACSQGAEASQFAEAARRAVYHYILPGLESGTFVYRYLVLTRTEPKTAE